MQCDRARDLLGAFADGELAGIEKQAVADHVQSCAACAVQLDDLARLGQQLRATARETAPHGLALRIREDLAADLALQATPMLRPPSPFAILLQGAFLRQAGALAAACLVSSLLTWSVMTWPGTLPRIESDVVAAHIRSLLQDSPIQVASSDSHTVKPWFAGRIDFAPEVKDFAADGFPLLGGRIDYVGDRRVGAVVYKRNLHVVNVFMWPAAGSDPSAVLRHIVKGYNVVSWSKSGVTYWAVSDLNLDELQRLQAML